MKQFLELLNQNREVLHIKPLGNQKKAWIKTLEAMIGTPIVVQKFFNNKLEESKMVILRRVYYNHAVCDIPLYDLHGHPNGTLSYDITLANLIAGSVVITELEADI